MMLMAEAKEIIGGLSRPSKMPGYGHSISAKACNIGSKLNAIEGSTCHGCYALKGRYQMHTVKNALENRLQGLQSPRWIEAMVKLIPKAKSPEKAYFRVHDSGDLQGLWHLENWNEVAKQRPDINFWLPTREYKLVADFVKKHPADFQAKNLNIRLSEHMINEVGPARSLAEKFSSAGYTVTWSGVYDNQEISEAKSCPAQNQDNECKYCRNCWDSNVAGVAYHKH